MFTDLGIHRVAAINVAVHLGDPERNADELLIWAKRAHAEQVCVATFPELCLTGYTCEDLFHQSGLLAAARAALGRLARATSELEPIFVFGAPYQTNDGRVFNCAFVVHAGKVLAAIPKIFLPNYGEFYEKRWFASGRAVNMTIDDPGLGTFRLAARQLFELGNIVMAVEICEDLWAPVPPSCEHALAGANLLVNPSASNDLVAKADYRRELVKQQSGRLIAAYVYAACTAGESTKDVVYGGDCVIAENGSVLADGKRYQFEGQMVTADLDFDKLRHDRAHNASFREAVSGGEAYSVTRLSRPRVPASLRRTYTQTPFVPGERQHLQARAQEIVDIQATGLARRLLASRAKQAILGLSGGLDSTLALLVSIEAARRLGRSAEAVLAISMPGFGTTSRTRAAAGALARTLGVSFREIPIDKAVLQHFADLGHDPAQHDLVYENAQARERTQILFDLANQVEGLVVGTGNMSELALGFCTYNADHMAGYAVNVSVPKTLVRHLVRWYAEWMATGEARAVLEGILDTPYSPELLPPTASGAIAQETEALIGPYVLHDFFLFHHLRNGFQPRKVLELASLAFDGAYTREEIRRWLGVFLKRFYTQQFKRTCLPPGPKVGSVSLSPRGDLRLPDEVDPTWIIAELDVPESG